MSYPVLHQPLAMSISPTAEAFRAAFRRPLLTLAEITWRWAVGATATVLFFFGLVEFLDTLPVTNGEVLFLRTGQPALVFQALAHILRTGLYRGVMSLILAALLMVLVWIAAASLGRVATVRAMIDYFRERFASSEITRNCEKSTASSVAGGQFVSMLRLNFLRVSVALAAFVGLAGAAMVAASVSSAEHPRPGLVFLLFLPMFAVVCFIGYALNWLLALASVFVVRDGEDAVGAIDSAVRLCRDRTAAILAVGTWTGIAHLIAFMGASTIVSLPLALGRVLPWRLVALGVLFITLAYFAVADWLYTARLAGYVCIADLPDPMLAPAPPVSAPPVTTRMQTTVDRDELILSDVPNLAPEM